MPDSYRPVVQRPALLAFLGAIGSREAALRRDECSDWRISGSRGHVYAVPGGFQIIVTGWTTNGWNRAKQALAFAALTNDGDDEGGFMLGRLPTKVEGEVIRKWAGIPKRAELSPERVADLRARGRKWVENRHRAESPLQEAGEPAMAAE